MISIPKIETERLILREPRETDLDAETEFYASDRSRFVGGPMTREGAWRTIATILGHWALRGYGFWGVEEKTTGDYIGRVGLWYPEGWPEREIGWTMMAQGEGKGYAFEAAKALKHHAYSELGWTTAISLIAPDNTRSIALAEKLGASFEREFVHERYGRTLIYRHTAHLSDL